jgi:formylglycine-generating enzyme required for sulfatase activity
MNKIVIFLVCILAFSLNTAFKKKKTKPKALPKSAKAIMSNLKMIKYDLYAGQTEVTNAQYNMFISEMELEASNTHSQFLLDTSAWTNSEITYCEPYKIYYHKHPAYNDYPVVNVSYQNAQAYCNWLTVKYNNDQKRKFKKVQFFLPTIEQWEFAAKGSLKQAIYPWGTFNVKNRKGQYMCNFRKINESNFVKDSVTGQLKESKMKLPVFDNNYYTANVYSYFPNDFGLYNCSGNVAEMVSTEGIAKGGSWNSYGGEILIKSAMNYVKANPEVGFRIFMKVDEK